MPPVKHKCPTAEYDKDIIDGILDLQNGSVRSVAAAARKYDVSDTTLQAQLK
jgi:hypothetical protein